MRASQTTLNFPATEEAVTVSPTAGFRTIDRPLTDIRTIVELIAGTTTDSGLTVQAVYDPNWYEKGVKITNRQMAELPLHPHHWHGEWNYTLTAA